MTQEITLRLPDKNTPGFLRRVREVNAIVQANDGLAAWWEGLANYVIERGYVEAPDGVDPHEAIGELSQAEMQHIAAALLGTAADNGVSAVDPQNGA